MARKPHERPADADPATVRRGERTPRQKLLSAARAVGLEVDDSWDDKRLESEIRARADGVADASDPAVASSI